MHLWSPGPRASGSQGLRELGGDGTLLHTRDRGFGELPSRAALHLGDSRPGAELALGSGAPPASQQASLSPGG